MGEELKGDVLVLDLKTMNMIRKYEGVAGYPVDLMVKYQKFLRDGKENGGGMCRIYCIFEISG